MLILQYFLPLSIISFAYARIWSKLRGHVSPAESGVNSSVASERHRRRRKTTKMLVTMVVVFAVSWLPFHAFQLATDIDSAVLDMRDFRLLYTVFHVIAMCSTFANPLLYGWMNRNYRAAFLAVFKCRSGGERERGGRLDSIHPAGGGAGGGGRRAKKIVLETQDVVSTRLNATDVWDAEEGWRRGRHGRERKEKNILLSPRGQKIAHGDRRKEDLKMCEKIETARVRGSQWGGLKSPNIEEKAGMIGD